MSDPDLWSDKDKAETCLKRYSYLCSIVKAFRDLEKGYEYVDLFQDDPWVDVELSVLIKNINQFEKKFLSSSEASLGAIVEINAGAGGTEAEDWARMLVRMYLMYGRQHDLDVEIISMSENKLGGVEKASLIFQKPGTYNLLKGETGGHRLVRVSPFNAQGKRMTSFASVYVRPLVDDSIDIKIDESLISWETFRSSGAGGQNVNKVESGVRLRYPYTDPHTGETTEILVENTETRDQPKNKDRAKIQLKSILYDKELQYRREQELKERYDKGKNEWGSQIRSYVFDDKRVKDHRTDTCTTDVDSVMNGNIDIFIKDFQIYERNNSSD